MNGIQGGGIGRPGLGGLGGALGAGRSQGPQDSPGGTSFGDTLEKALADVDGLQVEARDAVGAFLRGEPVEMHEVMAAAEEAGLALDFLIEVRNKLVDAYRSVIQMQS